MVWPDVSLLLRPLGAPSSGTPLHPPRAMHSLATPIFRAGSLLPLFQPALQAQQRQATLPPVRSVSSAHKQQTAPSDEGTTKASLNSPPLEWYHSCRRHFPFFSQPGAPIFFENAGGSQVPESVVSATAEYMRSSYAQLGAGYPLSEKATRTVAAAHAFAKTLMNAHGVGEVILGSNTSQLLENLARCFESLVQPGDEVVVHEASHEANAGPWYRLAERKGATVKVWRVGSVTMSSGSIDALEELVSERTKIVAVSHVSNILGEVVDLEGVVAAAKAASGGRAQVVADGVAFAPHRAMDVQAWGVDWYVFSTYKVYGPHMAALYGTHEALSLLSPFAPNHFFIPFSNPTYRFEVGGPSHESCAALLGLAPYIRHLASLGRSSAGSEAGPAGTGGEGSSLGSTTAAGVLGTQSKNAFTVSTGVEFDWSLSQIEKEGPNLESGVLSGCAGARAVVEAAFETASAMESGSQQQLLKHLSSLPGVQLFGLEASEPSVRVPTVSFTHDKMTSAELARRLQQKGFAVRNGHMYAYRLVEALLRGGKEGVEDGVVRVSLVHYNTPHEVALLCEALSEILV